MLVRSLALVALALGVMGCQTSSAPVAPKPRVGAQFRIVNLTKETFRYTIGGQEGLPVNPQSGGAYVLRRSRKLPFVLMTSGGTVIHEQEVDLKPAEAYTVVLHGDPKKPSVGTIEGGQRDPKTAGQSAIQVVNYGSGKAEGSVKLAGGDRPFALELGKYTEAFQTSSGVVELKGSVSGKNIVAKAEPKPGESHTFFIAGTEVIVVHDNPRMQMNITGGSAIQ